MADVTRDRQPAQVAENLTQEFEPFAGWDSSSL
jgi:hypothetical protein